MFREESRIELPPRPATYAGRAVAAWSETVYIDSYLPAAPDHFPAYLDSRVYQGSSGAVFPLPFHERIDREKSPHPWEAVHIENDWLRLMILPQLGGRIHVAYDKVADYDIFYRNNVIKPALVGLAGPWISGGVEFNWPQHHRPATFLPTDVSIEEEPDGSVTVWCSDHDPFARMKGMHGIRLRPDSSAIEARVRLYNRSETTQTFLWWANVAVAVNDDYQSFFPLDVTQVADHAKRAVVTYPEPTTPYYGIDYADRAPGEGRLDWYRNIPVPTSYMVTATEYEFFGGYDHGREAGFVHWADKQVSPGKKQWTWGNAPFGQAWDANLTDTDGPYVELMAGVFTDNQPDFAYIAAGETKSFSQFWYPLHGIGPVHQASSSVAARLDAEGDRVLISLLPADRLQDARISLSLDTGELLEEWSTDAEPGELIRRDRALDSLALESLVLEVQHEGAVVLRFQHPRVAAEQESIRPATAPPLPEAVESIDELVQIAGYLQQYRHATRSAEPYWVEALRRDPGETRASLGLGMLHYRRAEYDVALDHLTRSLERSTRWAPTPHGGAAHYQLGLVLERLGRVSDAAEALARASWDTAFALAAGFALARLHARQGEPGRAIRMLEDLVGAHPEHTQSADLLALLLRDAGEDVRADQLLAATLVRDPLDSWALALSGQHVTDDATTALDVALEFARAGFADRALEALDRVEDLADRAPNGQVNVQPLAAYHRAAILWRSGRDQEARDAADAAASSSWRYALPSRLDDIDALQFVIERRPHDALAQALVGHWFYHAGRSHDAIAAWERAVAATRDDDLAVVLHRNLGIAAYNVLHSPDVASLHYELALSLAPQSGRLWYEFDQLRLRMGDSAARRLARLEPHLSIVDTRDDLVVAYARLLLDAGRPSEAYELVNARQFQPWEGGEGLVLGVWQDIALALASEHLASGRPTDAARVLEGALVPPSSLGEARHPLANTASLHLAAGDARNDLGDTSAARNHWRLAADAAGDFTGMAVQEHSLQTVYSIHALNRLGEADAAKELNGELRSWVERESMQEATVDYFATSLPDMLLFVDDPAVQRRKELDVVRAQLAELG